jgi:hypothetical protein
MKYKLTPRENETQAYKIWHKGNTTMNFLDYHWPVFHFPKPVFHFPKPVFHFPKFVFHFPKLCFIFRHYEIIQLLLAGSI